MTLRYDIMLYNVLVTPYLFFSPLHKQKTLYIAGVGVGVGVQLVQSFGICHFLLEGARGRYHVSAMRICWRASNE
ncbi:hypothetical protein J3E72DRAFT_295836 [Bipolaris maydis]|nr:hypothetical protein J3E72DRAFT_295836 [Bipolaris maydis]